MSGDPEELTEPTGHRSRVVIALVVLAIAALVLVRLLRGSDGTPHHAVATPGPRSQAASPLATPHPSMSTDQEYVIDVPAQDMRAALARAACRGRCTAQQLTSGALARAVSGFAGMRPLAGGLVVRTGTGAYLQTVEGYATPDALVHLYSERVRLRPTAVRRTDTRGAGYRTVVLALVRGGWQLTVTLVVTAAAPPIRAATTWLTTSPLPR